MTYDVCGWMGFMVLPIVSVFAASATPTFVGRPDEVPVAQAAWRAAEACTGRPGRSTASVEIRHRTIPGGYLGVAHTHPDGTLYRIDLSTDPSRSDGRHREVLVHEVAHAWVSDGPIALVEGVAELLGDCMVAHTPGLATLQYDDGRELTGLVDLRTWAAPGAHRTEALGAIRTDAYIGASRLMRTAALVVPEGSLWPDGGLDWASFEALLTDAGPRGAALLQALRGGADSQRSALADRDLDGVPTLAETLLGTRDDAFDTDGDGWWDGAMGIPTGAVAVPLDGSPVCSGWAASADTTVRAYAGGNLRGHRVPRVLPRSGAGDDTWSTDAPMSLWGPSASRIPADASVLLQLDRPPVNATGAPWSRITGANLTHDPGCRSTVDATVWAHDRSLAPHIGPITVALHEAIAGAEARFGPMPRRVSVALGGGRTTVANGVVWWSTDEVTAAMSTGTVDALVYTTVSAHHLWSIGEPDWPAAEALARSLAQKPPQP